MKSGLIILVLFFLTKISVAQSDLQRCTAIYFLGMDSILSQGKDPFAEWHNCAKGKQMPDFSVETISGDKIETEKLRNKVLVINLWMIDCHPCIAELPDLNRLVKEYKNKDVVFIAVTTETLKRLKTDFFPKYKFDFNMAADAKPVIDLLGGSGYPRTFIIDKTGKIREVCQGVS